MTQYGQCVWFDLFSDNIPKATAFYSELFNWNTDVMNTPSGPYTIFKTNGKSVGGLTKPSEPTLANTWLAYISVQNLKTATSAIKQHGGTVMGSPTQMPGVGSWQLAKDPQGAVFCAFEGESKSADCANDFSSGQIGEFCWHELMCHNFQEELTFYGEVFGWKPSESIDMGPMGTYQLYNAGEKTVGGMMNNTPDMPQKTYWLEYINVDNVDDTLKRALSLGAHPTFPAMNVGNNSGRIAGLIDPLGTALAIHQPLVKK